MRAMLFVSSPKWSALALLLAAAISGCPDTRAPSAQQPCARAYEKCTLASGVLGVCDPIDCANGAQAPCFVCRSQH
jgi:hypothetical protein